MSSPAAAPKLQECASPNARRRNDFGDLFPETLDLTRERLHDKHEQPESDTGLTTLYLGTSITDAGMKSLADLND